MTELKVSDEPISWQINRAIVVKVEEWKNNCLVGNYQGCVIALIPYQSEEGRQNALKIAKQIVEANIDYTCDAPEIKVGDLEL